MILDKKLWIIKIFLTGIMNLVAVIYRITVMGWVWISKTSPQDQTLGTGMCVTDMPF